jgi:hypothetical protein
VRIRYLKITFVLCVGTLRFAHPTLLALSLLYCKTSYLHPVSSTTSKNADVEQAGRDDAGEA